MELELPARALRGLLIYGLSRVPTVKGGLEDRGVCSGLLLWFCRKRGSGAGLTTAPLPLEEGFASLWLLASLALALVFGAATTVTADHQAGCCEPEGS